MADEITREQFSGMSDDEQRLYLKRKQFESAGEDEQRQMLQAMQPPEVAPEMMAEAQATEPESMGQKVLGGLGAVGEAVESVGAAPARAATMALLEGRGLGEAAGEFGEHFAGDPALAPTSRDVVQQAIPEEIRSIPIAGSVTAGDVATVGTEIFLDPTGPLLKSIGITGKAAKAISKAATSKATDAGAMAMLKINSALDKVPEVMRDIAKDAAIGLAFQSPIGAAVALAYRTPKALRHAIKAGELGLETMGKAQGIIPGTKNSTYALKGLRMFASVSRSEEIEGEGDQAVEIPKPLREEVRTAITSNRKISSVRRAELLTQLHEDGALNNFNDVFEPKKPKREVFKYDPKVPEPANLEPAKENIRRKLSKPDKVSMKTKDASVLSVRG